MTGDATANRVRLQITGVVQGVGFRPTLARIASAHGLSGFVHNGGESVVCEWEGPLSSIDAAIGALLRDPPPLARITDIVRREVSPRRDNDFRIEMSTVSGHRRSVIPPDVATCDRCVTEMRDPSNRRYRHPFITCTDCGPRYTIITGVPYDRPQTTMAEHSMCDDCTAEYNEPLDRRFHAQPIACHRCGPTVHWRGPGGGGDPIRSAADAIADGMIVAIKGTGGYHLACRADDTAVVTRLRERKSRPAKPFALMVADVGSARDLVELSATAEAVLDSPARPIVLAARRQSDRVVDAVAPGVTDLGVMTAYSPIHHLLFDELPSGTVLVMTSANRGGSPICYRDDQLDSYVGDLADGTLTHDRRIHVPCEDSVVRIDAGADAGHEVIPLRRSRGYAPLPVVIPRGGPTVLAAGGDVKSTFCLWDPDGHAHMSSHLGDMTSADTQRSFTDAVGHLGDLTDRTPSVYACDLHPAYATRAWTRRAAGAHRVVGVAHHHAHAVSLLADHGLLGTPAIAVVYDGTGFGADGTIWGGEVLSIGADVRLCDRVGQLRPFALPGGESAVRQPARIAADLLLRAGLEWDESLPSIAALTEAQKFVLAQQIPRGIGCAPTSSVGRLFDAVSSLLGVCQDVTYEGQAAIEMEHVARQGDPRGIDLRFGVVGSVMDPGPVIAGLVAQIGRGRPTPDLAAAFHRALIDATTAVVVRVAEETGVRTVGLTGGVFANMILLDGLRTALRHADLIVLTHRQIPCNDGGLALGQAAIAVATVHKPGAAAPRSADRVERNVPCA